MPAYDDTYNNWLHDYRAGAGGYQSGTPGTLGSSASPTGGYRYTTGQSGGDFVKQNVKQDFNPFQGGSGAFANLATGGLSQPIRAFGGYRKFKKAQAADRMERQGYENIARDAAARAPTEYLGSIDPTSAIYQQARQRAAGGRDMAMSMDELQAGLRDEGQERQRAGYAKQVDDYFNSPERAGWQQQIVANRLQNDLANVEEDYGQNLRSSVQGAAARGLKGGSVDVEGRGAVARTRDTGAIQAAQNADAQSAQFRNQDMEARGQLHGLVNSRGIGDADSLRQALQGIHSATTAQGAQYAQGQQQRQLDRFGQQQQSQAWGQGLSGLASAIDRRPTNTPTYGGW